MVPTALQQLIKEILKGKLCVLYTLTGPNNCKCIGYKKKNFKPTHFILFNVWQDWTPEIIDSWREIFLQHEEIELAELQEYYPALNNSISHEYIEHIQCIYK